MYKLLLVDDEKEMLESFYELVDWKEYGFEVVAKRYNGLEALEYIENNPVDVVITDIRMPKMDGIELAGKLHESQRDIEIVFVSAFCDFHYARQAIKYGVVDYISKPIMRKDVIEILEKLSQNLGYSSEHDKGRGKRDAINLEREELFCGLLNSKILDIDDFTEELSNVKMPSLSLNSKCTLATFKIIGMDRQLEENWDNDRDKFCKAITEAVCGDTVECYAVRLSFSGNIIAVLYISKGESCISKEHMRELRHELMVMYEIIATNEAFVEFGSLREFKEKLAYADSAELKYLKGKISVCGDSQMVYETRKYVNEHYAEDINVKTIANQIHFSEQYFGRQFKKATGKNFLEYLSEVRIEKAKQILASGEKVEAVWERVGFKSRRYFEKQFLAYTGETPGQYRKNKMERK